MSGFKLGDRVLIVAVLYRTYGDFGDGPEYRKLWRRRAPKHTSGIVVGTRTLCDTIVDGDRATRPQWGREWKPAFRVERQYKAYIVASTLQGRHQYALPADLWANVPENLEPVRLQRALMGLHEGIADAEIEETPDVPF